MGEPSTSTSSGASRLHLESVIGRAYTCFSAWMRSHPRAGGGSPWAGLLAQHPPAGVARIEVDSHASARWRSVAEGDPVPHEATPGELLAITHAMFLAAVLSEALTLAGSHGRRDRVEATCTMTGPSAARRWAAVDLYAQGRVPGSMQGRQRGGRRGSSAILRATGTPGRHPWPARAVLATSG